MGRFLIRLFVAIGALASIASLVWVFAFPPASLRVNRDGVPHFTPPTVHPYSGETLRVETLVEHYKGAKR